jgi:DegV family protein with EDD domain
MTVRIVTDSVADIPPGIIKELDISIIPVLVRFGEETYRDGIDINNDQFYERLVHNKVVPTTAVPSLDMFARTYARLAEVTDEILVIMLSAKLSGLYNAALQSADLIEGNCRIKVIDSGWAVMAQGFVVIKAAQAAKAGAKMDEILEIVKSTLLRVDMRAAFDTLEYLKRGGRIGRAQALLGSMLKVNPIIMLKDGKVEPAGRTRSRAKAIDTLFEFAAGYSHIEELAVEEAACPEDSDQLVKRLGAIFPEERILKSRTTPVIGTHTGPGLLLLAVLGDK